MIKQGLRFAFGGVLVCLAACGTEGGDSGGVATCGAGDIVMCGCADGVVSTQVCGNTGAFGLCQCTGHGGPALSSGTAGTIANGAAGTFVSTAGTGDFGQPTAGVSGVGTAGVSGGFSGVSGGTAGDTGSTAGVSGGTAGDSGGGTAGTGVMTGGADPVIPSPSDACPMLKTGTVQVKGQNVQLWVGTKQEGKKGAVMFYWHGTGSQSSEAQSGLGGAITEITAEGGIVASFTTSTKKGQSTANNVWYTGDFEMADVILKCATEQLNIDTRRVYSAGCSAGGLQTGAMAFGRSSYLAAVMPNSGGIITFYKPAQDNPSRVPSSITTHGAMGKDVVGVDFATTSADFNKAIRAGGGFAVDCDHGGNHCASPSEVKAAQWTFLKAHPFGVSPEPYAGGLPGFPSYCKIIP